MLAALLLVAGTRGAWSDTQTWPSGLPVYDHVVIVIEENKDYAQIIGSKHAPYINALARAGASFSRIYGEEHNSQGNYFWLFSGDNQGVGFRDEVPTAQNNPKYPFTASSLGEQLYLAQLIEQPED